MAAFKIRIARPDEYEKVRHFYHALIRALEGAPYSAGWEIDIYPAPEYLRDVINKGECYIGELDGQIAACMVVNHDFNEGYNDFNWPTKAEKDEITVIHALGVHADFTGQGLARKMVHKAASVARENHQKVMRLDVLKGNLPAEKLYESEGFQKLYTLPMYYEDTGWTDYELYERLL